LWYWRSTPTSCAIFRGDTVHPSTLEVLAEIGLIERFLELPHRKVHTIDFVRDGSRLEVADFRTLGLRYPYIAFVPQWDLLNLITSEARRYPNFQLLMSARAHDLLREHDCVVGVRYQGPDGEHMIRAPARCGRGRPALGDPPSCRIASSRVRRADGRGDVPDLTEQRRPG
jgi:2-polyprenyl-6-methoxyphenol hydroxylase-like FAD-dependent oxidoreductase